MVIEKNFKGDTKDRVKMFNFLGKMVLSELTLAHRTAIKTLNETTIPGVNAEVAKKANSADVYTKTEVGTIAEGKTLVQMIEEAQSAATYDDTQVKADIKANADAIQILNGDVNTAGSVKAEAKAAADLAIATVVDSAPEAMNTLKEVADWIASDKEGSAALQTTVSGHTESINTINGDIDALEAKVDEDIANLTTHMSEAATALAEVDGRLDALEAFEETHASIEVADIEGLFA